MQATFGIISRMGLCGFHVIFHIIFNGFNDDLSFKTEFIVYENLSKTNNDRYEHILPSYNLSKGFDNLENLNGRLEINSSGSIKSYNTNITVSSF